MLPLNDKQWKEFEGGYRVRYDASIPLAKLEAISDAQLLDQIWSELWENLYHQGDVGVASYAAVPHLARLVRERNILDFNPFALAVAIELVRGKGKNPELPDSLSEEYHKAVRSMAQYACQNLNNQWDSALLHSVLALIAITKGHRDLGELIFEIEPDDAKTLLEKLFES